MRRSTTRQLKCREEMPIGCLFGPDSGGGGGRCGRWADRYAAGPDADIFDPRFQMCPSAIEDRRLVLDVYLEAVCLRLSCPPRRTTARFALLLAVVAPVFTVAAHLELLELQAMLGH